jgi:DNA-binding NarL/FixJ family response regulator
MIKSAGEQGRPSNVLVITNDLDVTHRLMAEAAGQLPFNLRFTTCEYDCSALVNDFKPDLAVLDCALGSQLTRDFIDHLTQDPRIPHIQIVLAVSDKDSAHKYESLEFRRVRRPFSIGDISKCISQRPDDAAHASVGKVAAGLAVLTLREREICTLLACGYTNAEIAGKLLISERTVETHRTHILKKLSLTKRSELVRFAIENKLLTRAVVSKHSTES